MERALVRTVAVAAYVTFLGALGLFVLFVAGLGPWAIDGGPTGGALAVDVVLVAFFGVAHSVMARAGWKRAWTRVVPPALERSVYVLVASAQIALLCWQWRAMPAPVWGRRAAQRGSRSRRSRRPGGRSRW
jgi:protein-S-isoprenylcysteine O-methyltransferase Ste14